MSLKNVFNLPSAQALAVFAVVTLITGWPFFLQGQIPIPGDLVLGGYHPWVDQKWDNRQTIFPVLNPSISDAITSFYPWRKLAIDNLKQGHLPTIDLYTYLGNPLFATGTTGVLDPLNIILLILPFSFGWGLMVALTPMLAASFFYLWIRQKGVGQFAGVTSSLCYSLSAFIGLQASFVNTSHTVFWLPLLLFLIDSWFIKSNLTKLLLIAVVLFVIINSGFIPGAMYLIIFSYLYLVYQLATKRSSFKNILNIHLSFISGGLLSAIQLLPFIELIFQSSRLAHYGQSAVDSEIFQFFVKPKYLITTLIPDFFGNPGKWNYFGDPNYYEFNNFTGTISLLGLSLGLLSSRLKEYYFWLLALVFSLFLATPNLISTFPYTHSWPIVSSLVPSRILLISQFCLITLSAYGLNYLTHKPNLKKVSFSLILTIMIYLGFLSFSYYQYRLGGSNINDQIRLRATLLPVGLMLVFSGLTILQVWKSRLKKLALYLMLSLTIFEMIRFNSYFHPSIKNNLLYPSTKTIEFLQKKISNNRLMVVDQDIFPSNLEDIYHLTTVNGVGPLFSDRLNIFLAATSANIQLTHLPRYKRVLFFSNPDSPIINQLAIKYILSTHLLVNSKFKLVNKEGSTYTYENPDSLPLAWFADKNEVIADELETLNRLRTLTDSKLTITKAPQATGLAKVEALSSNYNGLNIKTSGQQGLLVLSLQYDKNWQGWLDNQPTKLLEVNYHLSGITIPAGNHTLKLNYQPFSLKLGEIISGLTVLGWIILLATCRLIKKA